MRERVRRLLVADGHEVSVAGCFTPEPNSAADALIVEDSMLEITLPRPPVAVIVIGRTYRAAIVSEVVRRHRHLAAVRRIAKAPLSRA